MAGQRKRGPAPPRIPRPSDLREATILIPLTYNNGMKVPAKVLEAIEEEIFVNFKGWTDEGTVRGAYRMQSGEKHVERLRKMTIVVQKSSIPQLEAMVARWGAILGQEAMLLKVSDLIVRFVAPESKEQ